MKTLLIILPLFILPTFILAQEEDSPLEIEAYADAYYAYFSDETEGFQKFTTVSPYNNQISLNVAQIGLHYTQTNFRSNVVFHYGDIMKATWSSVFLPVQEANIGVHLIKNWWLDAGLFRTHIGTESFLPKNNFLSSTAMATYNEPFYQAGAKLGYEGSDQFDFELWALNGYNLFFDNNKSKSVGILFTYYLGDHTSFTYTNIIGNESTDPNTSNILTYHNFYINSEIIKNWFWQLGVDFGTDQNNFVNSDEGRTMYNYLITTRYQFTKALSATVRYENFQDRYGMISDLIDPFNFESGLQAYGITVGAEVKPNENSYLRIEYRRIESELDIYISDNSPTGSRNEFLVTMGHYFTKQIKGK